MAARLGGDPGGARRLESSRHGHVRALLRSGALQQLRIRIKSLTSTLTVRKWWRRYEQLGPSGLRQRSRAPHCQLKQDLAHIKAQSALFQRISADTRDLDDIPHVLAAASAVFALVFSSIWIATDLAP
jgi:hypothetical protein